MRLTAARPPVRFARFDIHHDTHRALIGLAAALLAVSMIGQATASPPTPAADIPPSAFVPVTLPARIYESDLSTPRPRPQPSIAAHPIVTTHHPTVAEAKAYALARLGPTQYACLANIVHHEDGTWDPYRQNMAGSTAYGIPQALPGSKMASAGADWRWNRITQVRWMIGYVDRRYGSACEAWAFWQRARWY